MKKLTLALALIATLACAGASSASAPPVGKLPPSPTTTIVTYSQEMFAFALPRGQSGLVWRGARNTNWRVAKPLREADVGNTLILIYVAGTPGVADIAYGLTNGERPKVYRAARYHIVVKPRPR